MDSEHGAQVALEREPRVEGRVALYVKLKPGPHLPREQVHAHQRDRLHGAMLALVDRDGWGSVRVRALAQAAGVSTATVYKHFANADECLASTYDAVTEDLIRKTTDAQRRQPDWTLSLRAAVFATLNYFGASPAASRLALLEIFGGGPTSRKRISPAVNRFERTLAASFAAAPREMVPPRHLVAGMTAGLLHVARTTTARGRESELPGLVEELSDWMLSLPSPHVLSLSMSRSAYRKAIGRASDALARTPEQARPHGSSDRERILRTAVKLSMSEGFQRLTAARLRADAGVSRSRFDACFNGLEECFLEAIEMAAVDAVSQARKGLGGGDAWNRQTCRLMLAICTHAARDRSLAQLVFQRILAVGRTGLLKRERLIATTATVLRNTVPAAERPSATVAEASIAAGWHISQTEIATGRARSLPLVASLLSYVVLAPIVGPQNACSAIHEEIQKTDAQADP